MTQKERENFYRNSTLIVHHSKDSVVSLIEFDLTKQGMNFEDFVNRNAHDIYHLCYNRNPCCRCTTTNTLPLYRILHPPQLDLLFDTSSPLLPCHNPNSKAKDCCRRAKPGIITAKLDFTLARVLVLNFCLDVLWQSVLQKSTLQNFLNTNKHDIYHLSDVKNTCCMCQPTYTKPVGRCCLPMNEIYTIFIPSASLSPCRNPAPTGPCLTGFTAGSILVHNLSYDASRALVEHISEIGKSIETLRIMRNEVYAHSPQASISDADFLAFKKRTEDAIMNIATFCGNASDMKKKLERLQNETLDEKLLKEKTVLLLEAINKDSDLIWVRPIFLQILEFDTFDA